jgi:hypothetical protein
MSSVVIWMVTSFFGTAFQCGAHGPWDAQDAKCINQASKAQQFFQSIKTTWSNIEAGRLSKICQRHQHLDRRRAGRSTYGDYLPTANGYEITTDRYGLFLVPSNVSRYDLMEIDDEKFF